MSRFAHATRGRLDGKPGGLSPRTLRHIHLILKAALGRAVEQQVLARNPADACRGTPAAGHPSG
jgi:hypothetical protein